MKNLTSIPSAIIPSTEVEWVETSIYAARDSYILSKYRVLKPSAGERFVAFSLQSLDFIDTLDYRFNRIKLYQKLYGDGEESGDWLLSQLKADDIDKISPEALLFDSLKCYYAGYVKNAEGNPSLSKLKIATPPHIASGFGFRNEDFTNPLSTGDFSEVNGIEYSRLNLTQYLGNLYFSPDYYSSGEDLVITAQNGGGILFQGVSTEPLNNRLLANYLKEEDGYECGYLGVIDLDTGILCDFIEIPAGSEYHTRLAWIDDHTFFAGGPIEGTGAFYMWSIYDLNLKKEIAGGALHEDEPNIIIAGGEVLAEHLETPQRIYPPEAPRKNDPVRISLHPDPADPVFAEIREGRITVIIKNVGNDRIRLLNPWSMEDEEYCFSFIMDHYASYRRDIPYTSHILSWSLGNYPVDEEDADYMELLPQEEWRIELNFCHNFSPYDGEPLYLSLSYVNMSGSNCLKGIFTSVPMRFDFRNKGCLLEIGGGGPITD